MPHTKIRVIGVDNIGINKMLISLKKIARMQARMRDTQKLRQKSQLNNFEIILGALVIMASLIPVLPNSKMINAGTKIK